MKPEKLLWEHWSDELTVGHASVDEDHRRILDLISRLQAAFSQGGDHRAAGDGIRLIAEYSESHFQREERMLAAAGYAHLDHHRARHQSFRDYVAYASSASHPIDPGELLSYLVDWWVGHIASEDKMYRSALAGKDEMIRAAFADHDGEKLSA